MTPDQWLALAGLLAIAATIGLIAYSNRAGGTVPPAPKRDPWSKASPLALAVYRADQAAVDLQEQITTGDAEGVRRALYRTNTTVDQLAHLLEQRERENRHES